MSRWSILYDELKSKYNYIKPQPPASPDQIVYAEESLGILFPDELKEFLLEINGDGWFVFSVDEIIKTNLLVREEMIGYMPLECLLFFAGNGCGDYFGYPITRDGLRNDNVFIWEHEYDNRVWKAGNLEETIRKYYNSEI